MVAICICMRLKDVATGLFTISILFLLDYIFLLHSRCLHYNIFKWQNGRWILFKLYHLFMQFFFAFHTGNCNKMQI